MPEKYLHLRLLSEPLVAIGLVVRFKRVGEDNLGNTTAKVPKPFVKGGVE